MFVSSRTPEGEPNRCPLCGGLACIEPSLFYGDAPCPQCGQLLWFINVPLIKSRWSEDAPGKLYLFNDPDRRERLLARLAEFLGVSREEIQPEFSFDSFTKDHGMDSLDLVELIMELEEDLDDSGDANHE